MNNSLIIESIPQESLKSEDQDYTQMLSQFGCKYIADGAFLLVSQLRANQGWLLHLSITKHQIQDLLNITIPYLLSQNVAFKIPRNLSLVKAILNGEFGTSQIGKIITIYPNDDLHSTSLAKTLIRLTNEFKGPKVPTDFQLGNIVYTRYGSYKDIVHPSTGNLGRFIILNSEIIEDRPNIPFVLVKNIPWPFTEIVELQKRRTKKLLNDRYKILTLIKNDAKGNVYQGLYFKNFMIIKKCIIKEGKANMWIDDFGRSIRDRLIWQYELYKGLDSKVPIPKIFDIFHEEDDTHLAMEYINGKSLTRFFDSKNEIHSYWPLKPSKIRRKIINILIKITDIIAKLHQLGIIHRDITPSNFIITKDSKVFLIDLELAYSIVTNSPNPPFRLGTPGFMSHEQSRTHLPTVEQDIYSLGALISVLTTSFTSVKFDGLDKGKKVDALFYLTKDECLSELVSSCLSENPANRPSIKYIQTQLKSIYNNISAEKLYRQLRPEPLSTDSAKDLVNKALDGLSGTNMLNNDNVWKSALNNTHYSLQKYQIGFHSGIAGTLYLIATAKLYGFNIDSCNEAYQKSISIAVDILNNKNGGYSSSLMDGTAGLALSLKAGFDSGLLEKNEINILTLSKCFTTDNIELNFANGVAGIGYVLNKCKAYLTKDFVDKIEYYSINKILESQQKNGTWENILSSGLGRKEAIGLVNGIAGIILYLISYVNNNTDDQIATKALKQALSWLENQILAGTIKSRLKLISTKLNINDWSVYNGTAGIALCFIRAFDLFKETQYKKISEKMLHALPEILIDENLSQAFGLTGLGEVYIEACRVLENKEWLTRTHWITSCLKYTIKNDQSSKGFWSIDSGNEDGPSASLMTGNAGVIHYLMRYLNPYGTAYII